MRFIITFLFIVVIFGSFVVSSFEKGFHQASNDFTDGIGAILIIGALVVVFMMARSLFARAKIHVMRKSEGTFDISNDKFIERVIKRAADILQDSNLQIVSKFILVDEQVAGENGEYQIFFYKLSNDAVDQQEEETGKSFGFSFMMAKKAGSSCLVEKLRGMNDKMDSIAKRETASVEVAAKFVASQSKSISKWSEQRKQRKPKAA